MFKIGNIVEQYKIISQVGRGSYGTVYEVENIVSYQKYALKCVNLKGQAQQRELDAIRHYRDLKHPNLIQIYHVGIVDNILFYTMDWADDTFASCQVSASELTESILQILDALKLLHSHKLIHRDIKPDNILWIKGRAVLGDIGLLSHQSTASFAGSPGFIPPQIWQGRELPNEYADLFALAKVIYCLISQCSVGDYPNYRGSRDECSSQLFNAVLTVCRENSKIKTVEQFKELLTQKPLSPKKISRKCVVTLSCCIVIGLVLLLILPTSSKEKLQKESVDNNTVTLPEEIKAITPPKKSPLTAEELESVPVIKNLDDMYLELQRLKALKANYPNEIRIMLEKHHSIYTQINREVSDEIDAVPPYKLNIVYSDFYNKLSPNERTFYESRVDLSRKVIANELFQKRFPERCSKEPYYRYQKIEISLESMENKFYALAMELPKKSPPSKLAMQKVEESFRELQQSYKDQIIMLSKP